MNVEIVPNTTYLDLKVHLGILSFNSSVTNNNTELWKIINNKANHIKTTVTTADIAKIPNINAAKEFYKKCKKDPNRYRLAADSLLRRIINGNDLYQVNTVVDILNLVSIDTGISIGAYNTDKIFGEVKFDIATADDIYEGIGRGKLNIENMPVLRDDKGIFGSPTSDSARTMITLDTKQVAFVFYDFGFCDNLSIIVDQTKDLLSKFKNGIGYKYSEISI